MRQLEGFYAPFGHKVRECTFCNIYIFVLDICYQQLGEMCQLEGFCAFFGCRPCTALQGEGTYIFVIYVFVLDICCQYLGNILSGGPAVRGPTVRGPNCPGPNCPLFEGGQLGPGARLSRGPIVHFLGAQLSGVQLSGVQFFLEPNIGQSASGRWDGRVLQYYFARRC